MGKRSRKEGEALVDKSNGTEHVKKPLQADDEAVDPTLALLFASSVSFRREIDFISFMY
jgi:hypothetical protein